jgi:1-acyl-sn-glycerol-3-phosphate acyltransferase
VGKLDPNRDRFILRVLAGISIITFLGLIIDYAFFSFPIMGWAFAAVLIFISIYIVAYHLVKINNRVSALIGIGMVAANLASWFFSISNHGETPVDPLLLLAVLPLLLIVLYKWHRAVFLAK